MFYGMSSLFVLDRGDTGIFSSEFALNQNSVFLFYVNTGIMRVIKRKNAFKQC